MNSKKTILLILSSVIILLGGLNAFGLHYFADIQNNDAILVAKKNESNKNSRSDRAPEARSEKASPNFETHAASEGSEASETETPQANTPLRGSASEKMGKDLADIMDKNPNSFVDVVAEFKVKPGSSQVEWVEKTLGGSVKQRYKNLNAMAIRVPAQAVAQLTQRDAVKRLDLDFEVKTTLDTSREIIEIDTQRRSYGYLGEGVKVAVIDTGVDRAHPALTASVVETVDFTGGGPTDLNGHGTHVACIIACDDETYSGIAPAAEIYSAKALRQDGRGYISEILQALDWAMDKNVDVINLSLGGYVEDCGLDVFSQIINSVSDQGFLVAVAAGNNGPNAGTVLSPGCAENALTVGATDDNGALASFSSRGPTAEGLAKPDVVAPGVGITAAFLDGRWASLSGTSMATPHVAGLSAILLEADSSLNPNEVKAFIEGGAKDLSVDENSQGAGLVQALDSLEMIRSDEEAPEDEEDTPPSEEDDSEEDSDAPEENDDSEEDAEDDIKKTPKNLFGKCVSEAVKEGDLTLSERRKALQNCHEEFNEHRQNESSEDSKPTPSEDEEEHEEVEESEENNSDDESEEVEIKNTATIPSSFANFNDVDQNAWFYPYLYSLNEAHCIRGYADGQFKPEREVSLGESLKLMSRCLLGEDLHDATQGHWATNDLNYLLDQYENRLSDSILKTLKRASENAEMLDKKMDRQTAVELIVSVLAEEIPQATEAPFLDVPLSHPSVNEIAHAKALGIITGNDNTDYFEPEAPLNRAAMVKLVFIAKQHAK